MPNITDPSTLTYLVEKFGFPIAIAMAAFIVLVSVLMLTMRSQIKRQEKLDSYYFKNIDTITDENKKLLVKLGDELSKVVTEIKCVSTKIDTYVSKLDSHFEPKNVAYIFRDDKIGKVKSVVEEVDVTGDIERGFIYNRDRDTEMYTNNQDEHQRRRS